MQREAVQGSRNFGGIQIALVVYVLLTGDLLKLVKAALHGVDSSAGLAFAFAVTMSICLDFLRISPLFFLKGRKEGILHPLIVTVVLWPVLLQLPYLVETLFSNIGGLTGEAVRTPVFAALPAASQADVWWGEGFFIVLQLVSLLAIFVGWRWASGVGGEVHAPRYVWNDSTLRTIAVSFILLIIGGLVIFLALRGGLQAHIADLSRGRARALEGLGPIVALFDASTLCLMVWVAIRPKDVRSPLFIGLLISVVAVQFISDGSRSSAILVMAKVGLVWALRSGKLPLRLAVFLLPIGLSLFGALAIIRSSGQTGDTALQAIVSARADQVLDAVQTELEGRRYLSGSAAIVLEGHEVLDGPLLGQTYLAAVFAFVPRPLWEDKPRGAGSMFAQTFLGTTEDGFAVPIGAVAEAYWNFNVPGVVVLFVLYGFLLRRVHGLYLRRYSDPFVTTFYVLFLSDFQPGTDSVVPFMQQATALLLIFLFALAIGARKQITPRPGFSSAVDSDPAFDGRVQLR